MCISCICSNSLNKYWLPCNGWLFDTIEVVSLCADKDHSNELSAARQRPLLGGRTGRDRQWPLLCNS